MTAFPHYTQPESFWFWPAVVFIECSVVYSLKEISKGVWCPGEGKVFSSPFRRNSACSSQCK